MAESKKTVAAEMQDKPTAAETLSELDRLVIGFIDGALDVATLNSLDMRRLAYGDAQTRCGNRRAKGRDRCAAFSCAVA